MAIVIPALPGVASYPVEIVAPYGGAGTDQSVQGYYSGRFIPSIWSGKILEKFYDSTVLPAISNTDYEGEIKNQGDHVIIRTRPTITVADYKADQELVVERPMSDVVELLIDKGLYWNAVVDDIMDVQADVNMMSLWAQDAAEQMKIAVDTRELDLLYSGISANNKGAVAGVKSGNINLGVTGTPVDLTAAGSGAIGSTNTGLSAILHLAIKMGQVMDEQNIPESGRWLVVDAATCSLIKMSELRQVDMSGDSVSSVRNGYIGKLNDMDVYKSNLLPAGLTATEPMVAGEHIIYAGSSIGLTFASQLTKIETLRAETTFGTLMRGLNVWGSKVVQPTALVGAIVTT